MKTKYFMLIHGNCTQLFFDKLRQIWNDYQQGINTNLPTIDLPENSYISFIPIPSDYSSKKYMTITRGMTMRQLEVFNEIMNTYETEKLMPCIQVTLNGGIEFKEFPKLN